jgi:hypothetical protein
MITHVADAAETTLSVNVTAAGPMSPDGTMSASPNGASIITNAGVWTWGASTGDGQYNVNLNGVGRGIGVTMEVENNGQFYVNTIARGWWLWNGGSFGSSTPPPPPIGTLAVVITVVPSTPTIPDTTAKGTVVADFKVNMNDLSPFTGDVTFGSPNFDGGGVFSLSTLTKDPSGSVSGHVLVNPSGPGVGPNTATVTDHITLVATQP